MINVAWSDLKTALDNRNVTAQYLESDTEYKIWAIDGPFALCCKLHKSPTDTTDLDDWETNYKSVSNTSFTDSNGIPLSRGKVTQTGWFYQEQSIEISTATTGGVYSKDSSLVDLGYTTYTMYDALDVVTAVPANAVKTVIRWTPDYDYEIIGAKVFQGTVPTNDLRMWVTAVPDLAPTKFVDGGMNLKHMGIGNVVTVDGRSAKSLKYNDPIPGTNTFEVVLKHNAGDVHTLLLIVEHFRP